MMFLLDSHCDTPSQIYRLRDINLDNERGHVDFPKLRRGGVDGSFFAIYTSPSKTGMQATSYALELMKTLKSAVAAAPDMASFAYSPSDAYRNRDNGLFSVFIGLENGSPIGNSIQLLRDFYGMGVRYMTLCHSKDNAICDSCAEGRTWNGLSPFGKEVVAEMNRLGMMIDVSHISDKSFYDVLEYSELPVVATHSCCRALAGHPRNMSDDMIRALASKGGVIQINFYPVFLDDGFAKVLAESRIEERGDIVESIFISDPADKEKRQAWYEVEDELSRLPRPSFTRIADHIDHVVELVGIDHVGLGSDFDGIAVTPKGMDSAADFHKILEELSRRGYTSSDIEKIAGGNFFRVFNENIDFSQQKRVKFI
ncbi:MAG: dipeptidase [Candidatus Cryptobacteroides sp.]